MLVTWLKPKIAHSKNADAYQLHLSMEVTSEVKTSNL